MAKTLPLDADCTLPVGRRIQYALPIVKFEIHAMAHRQSLDTLLRNARWHEMAETGLWFETPMDLGSWTTAKPRVRHVAWVALALVASVAVLLFV
jgi:hypothetical protein